MSDLVAELDKVKKDVRSLLISAPNGLTPKMLEKDYAAVIGCCLPFEKFGFCNSVEFLRPLTDILHVSLRNGQILFYGIADKSTKHILNMVRKQKKPKFYNSITSNSPVASSKRKSNTSSNFPSALTRSGVLKVLNVYPDGFSIMKLHDYFEKINGTKLDVRSTTDIPSFIMNMPDIAKLDYGKKEKSGNNLYIFPSKSLFGYQTLFEKNLHGASPLPPRLRGPPNLSHTSTTSVTTASSVSKNIQSWVNSVNLSSGSLVVSTVSSTTTTASAYSKPKLQSETSHINVDDKAKPCTSNSVLQKLNVQRFQKLNSTTSSGIMSQAFSSDKSGTYSETDKSAINVSPVKIEDDHDEFDSSLVFNDTTPPASALLKQEIVDLLKDCKTEVRSIKVASLYKKKYAKELCLHKHGYYSIIELVATMTEQISMCRLTRTGEWLFKLRNVKSEKSSDSFKYKSTDKAAKIATVEREFKELLNKYKGGIAVDSLEDLYEMHFERNLPLKELSVNSAAELVCKIVDTLNLSGDQLCLQSSTACDSMRNTESISHAAPLDAVGFGIRYKPALLPSADWGFFDCFVTYVNTPSDFRIQIIGEDTTEAFNLLMDDIERTYCHSNAKIYRIPPHMVVPGQICVAIFHGDNNWNRAVIEEAPSGGFVKVRYVDFGDIASVSTAAVYYLKQKYVQLPILEVHACLANIRPARSSHWDIAARKQLLDFSKNKQLVARVTGEEERKARRVFSLELCDVSTGDDIYINDVLLEKRLAVLPDEDDLEPEEIQHIIDNLPGATKPETDIPSESPPPYQATENIPPLVNFAGMTSSASSVPLLPMMPPLSVTHPPPGFGSAAPRKEITALEINKLIESLSEKKQKESPNDSFKNKVDPGSKSVQQKQQKKFIKPFRLNENLNIHVINFKGTALLLSGEISRIFRPDSDDMLAPLLMMKGIHENFPELVLANNQENAMLFTEFQKFKVKQAFKSEGLVRPVITLHRLSDVPEMITELEHVDKVSLNKRLNEIISIFDPDNGYWYRGANDCLGSRCEEYASDSDYSAAPPGIPLTNADHSCSSSTLTLSPVSSTGVKKFEEEAATEPINSEERLQLHQKKNELLQQLTLSSNPSNRLFNELKRVMKSISQIDGDTKDVLASGDGLNITADQPFDACAIPADDSANVEGFFSEIRDSCDDLLNLSSNDENNAPHHATTTSSGSSEENPILVTSSKEDVSVPSASVVSLSTSTSWPVSSHSPFKVVSSSSLQPTPTLPVEALSSSSLQPTPTLPVEALSSSSLQPTPTLSVEALSSSSLQPTLPVEALSSSSLQPTSTLPVEVVSSSSLQPTSTLPVNYQGAPMVYQYVSPDLYLYPGNATYTLQQYNSQQGYVSPQTAFPTSSSHGAIGWPSTVPFAQQQTVMYSNDQLRGGVFPFYL